MISLNWEGQTSWFGRSNKDESAAKIFWKIKVESKGAYSVVLANAGIPNEVNGARYTMDGENIVLTSSGNSEIMVK